MTAQSTSGLKILIADDSPSDRATARAILSEAGFGVVEATDGQQVLELFSRERPALVMLDVVMPKMSGPDLAERLAAIRPGMRTLFMSGYNRGHLVPAEDEKRGIAFLEKPFTYSALVQKVAALIALAEAGGEAKQADEPGKSDAETG